MRKLKRSVAHNKMRKSGYTRINKDRRNGSFFSRHWREFV